MPELSKREVECLYSASHGETALETASRLNLSKRTVEHYLESASQKLNAKTRTEAVAIALRMGIISD